MTLGEFEKLHPDIARDLRMMSGDRHTDRPHNTPAWARTAGQNEVTEVYGAYEEDVQVWYATVEAIHGWDIAVYKDGKWSYTGDYWTLNL